MNGRTKVFAFRLIAAILERLPLRWTLAAVAVVSPGVARLSSTRAKVARNLRVIASGGGEAMSEVVLDRAVKRAFESYGHYWAEGAKLGGLDTASIQRPFAMGEGSHHLFEAYERGRGVVVALPHTGSWEWGGAAIAARGCALVVVAEELTPPELFDFFVTKRERIGLRVVPLNTDATAILLDALGSGAIVALLCDRDIQGSGIEVEFFGRRVTMPAGPATLALRTGAALVVACTYIGPGDGHVLVVAPPLTVERQGRLRADVSRLTQDIAHHLEGFIRRAPEQWHVLEDRFERPS